MYLDGYHNYQRQSKLPANQQHQMRVAHYCQMLNEDFTQCAVYDGNTRSAHLIGIEYIVSDRLFKQLPKSEQKYWHPHDGEVDTGMLLAPGIPAPAQKVLLAKIRSTHGKTWRVWDTMNQPLPFGNPQLMWAIKPSQINAATRKSMAMRRQNPRF